MKVKPARGRAKIRTRPNKMEIIIPSQKQGVLLLLLSLWLIPWSKGLEWTLKYLIDAEVPIVDNLFSIVWLVFWMMGGVSVFWTIIWQLTGSEGIIVELGKISLRTGVLGIHSTKEYAIAELSKLTLHQYSEKCNSTFQMHFFVHNKNNVSKLKFNYGLKTIKFAKEIDEAEAEHILELLNERLLQIK